MEGYPCSLIAFAGIAKSRSLNARAVNGRQFNDSPPVSEPSATPPNCGPNRTRIRTGWLSPRIAALIYHTLRIAPARTARKGLLSAHSSSVERVTIEPSDAACVPAFRVSFISSRWLNRRHLHAHELSPQSTSRTCDAHQCGCSSDSTARATTRAAHARRHPDTACHRAAARRARHPSPSTRA